MPSPWWLCWNWMILMVSSNSNHFVILGFYCHIYFYFYVCLLFLISIHNYIHTEFSTCNSRSFGHPKKPEMQSSFSPSSKCFRSYYIILCTEKFDTENLIILFIFRSVSTSTIIALIFLISSLSCIIIGLLPPTFYDARTVKIKLI